MSYYTSKKYFETLKYRLAVGVVLALIGMILNYFL
jgi:hypothetical protein